MWVYTLFPTVLNMSLTAGIVIVLVLLARVVLKKVPKIFSYGLWAVVLFRLVCPVSFSSELSLLGVFNAPASANGSITYIPADIIYRNPQVDLPIPIISEALNDSLPQGEEQLGGDPLEGPMAIATILWLCGIVAMLIYSAVSLMSLRYKLIGSVHLRDNIYLADHIATPFVIGVIRPKIFLPSVLTEQEQSYIILHEQTHIKRFDHIFKMIAFLALAMHWFNPLVWVAFICAVKDMEMSCDERVLKEMGVKIKSAYSTSLLSLATGQHLINGSPLAFGEGNIKGRIKNVMNFKKPAFWILIVAVFAVAGVCFCLITNPVNSITNNNEVDLSDIEQMNIGAEMPHLLYGDENLVVMQGTFGLLVYDINDSLVTNRLSYNQLSLLGISMLRAAVSVDGTIIYIGGIDKTKTKFLFTYQYDIKTNAISDISQQPSKVFIPIVINPGPGYNEQYDKYFDFNYLIGGTIIDFENSFLYLRANTDWSMKSLQIVICQYKDGMSEIQNIFTTEFKEEANSAQPLIFSSDETDLLKIGMLAFDTYMTDRMSEKTPVSERIASYQLNDISILAGDINEFCVSLNYDITTDNDNYLNAALGAKGKGIWPANYMEIRVKHADENVYSIKSIGTGGGGQGLTPYAERTVLEPTSPKLSLEQEVSVDMVELDYASDDIVIFHDYFGLFVYDLNSKQMIRSLDLNPIGCTATQGDDYCEVTVSTDGNTVQLHPMSSKNMYIYTVSDNTLQETAYKRMDNRFTDFVDIVDVIDDQKAGNYSHTAVKLNTDEYGYLHTSDLTLGTLTYVREGDMLYRLFDFEESSSSVTEDTTYLVTDNEINSAKDTAFAYYENTVFKGSVTDISQITDITTFESAIIPHRKRDLVIAFYVVMSDNAQRMIVLTKEKDGEWEVINEGV